MITSSLEPAITRWAQFRETWTELHSELPHSSLFLSTEWVDCWLSVFGESLQPLLWVAKSDGTPIGAALLVERVEWRGPIPVRCLYLNTAGEGSDSVTLEHNTLLTKRGAEDSAWKALELTLRRMSWDELKLEGANLDTRDRVRLAFSDEASVEVERVAPYVPLATVRSNPDGILGMLSPNTRYQLRRAARLHEKHSAITLEEAVTIGSRREVWSELERLHTLRWLTRGSQGAFSHPRWRTFHEQLLLQAPGQTRLFRLRSGPTTLAAVYLFDKSGNCAFYQSGVRAPVHGNQDKIGMLIHSMLMDHLAHRAENEYDFLASYEPEVRYKRRLSTQERSLYWLTILRPTLRNRLVSWLKGFRSRQAI